MRKTLELLLLLAVCLAVVGCQMPAETPLPETPPLNETAEKEEAAPIEEIAEEALVEEEPAPEEAAQVEEEPVEEEKPLPIGPVEQSSKNDFIFYVDGQKTVVRDAPLLMDGQFDLQFFAPVEPLMQALGAQTVWQADQSYLTCTRGDTTVIITPTSSNYIINGEETNLGYAAVYVEGQLLISYGHLWEFFGDSIYLWNDFSNQRILYIESKEEGEEELTEEEFPPQHLFLFNGVPLDLGRYPLFQDSERYYADFVPLERLFTDLRIKVEWASDRSYLTCTQEDTVVIITPASSTYNVDGEDFKLTYAAVYVDEELYINFRLINRLFRYSARITHNGFFVYFDSDRNINRPGTAWVTL